MSENEKDKEIKKTSEAESYEEYEGEAIEDVEESPESEKVSTSEVRVPLGSCRSAQSVTVSDSEQRYGEERSRNTYQRQKELILREKWLSVTGKKPRNIPTVRKPLEEDFQKYVFFGDKRPMEVEKNIRRKLLMSAQKIESRGLKFGIVRQEIRLTALFSGLLCIQFDPTAQFMACSNRKGGAEIWRTQTGEVVLHLNTLEQQEKLPVRSLRYLPQDPEKIYAAGQIGSIQVFNATTGEQLGVSDDFGSIYSMDINASGSYLATGGKDGKIQVVDPSTLQVISRREWPKRDEPPPPHVYDEYHRMKVYGLRFHDRYTSLFATGGWDNTVKIWDVRINSAIRSIKGPGIHGDGLDIKNNLILTASWRVEDSLNLWDFSSGKLIKNVPIKTKSTKFEGEFLCTCRFFKDNSVYHADTGNKVAVGGSGFSDVIIINVKNDTIEQQFPSFKPVICMDINGKLLAYGGTESMCRIAEVEAVEDR